MSREWAYPEDQEIHEERVPVFIKREVQRTEQLLGVYKRKRREEHRESLKEAAEVIAQLLQDNPEEPHITPRYVNYIQRELKKAGGEDNQHNQDQDPEA